jgi:hypothetical protein
MGTQYSRREASKCLAGVARPEGLRSPCAETLIYNIFRLVSGFTVTDTEEGRLNLKPRSLVVVTLLQCYTQPSSRHWDYRP